MRCVQGLQESQGSAVMLLAGKKHIWVAAMADRRCRYATADGIAECVVSTQHTMSKQQQQVYAAMRMICKLQFVNAFIQLTWVTLLFQSIAAIASFWAAVSGV
jgi:hypothetical protein